MARALGPSEKRNIVLTGLLFSQNSACTSSIFSLLSRAALFPERSACARHFMSHNYCSSLLILRYLYLRFNPLRSSLLLLFFLRVINHTRLNELSRRTVQTWYRSNRSLVDETKALFKYQDSTNCDDAIFNYSIVRRNFKRKYSLRVSFFVQHPTLSSLFGPDVHIARKR